jgi:hypothetical protein
MDLTFFAVHSRTIAGRQRGVNVDAWLIPYLALQLPATLRMRYRHVDTGEIVAEPRPFTKLQKNIRLHGKMVQGAGYQHFGAGDIMLLHFTGTTVTWSVLQNQGRQKALFTFLNNPKNVETKRNMGIVLQPTKISALETLLSNFDAPLFFADELEAIDAEPSSPTVRVLVRRKMSPATFANLQKSWERNGALGEKHVLAYERKRLADAGHRGLADRVHHVAQDDATSPYDILSFEGSAPHPDAERFVEVKSTSGDGMEFEMSEAEWRFAEQNRQQHVICRVTQVTSTNPVCRELRDVVGLVGAGAAQRKPIAFRVRIVS